MMKKNILLTFLLTFLLTIFGFFQDNESIAQTGPDNYTRSWIGCDTDGPPVGSPEPNYGCVIIRDTTNNVFYVWESGSYKTLSSFAGYDSNLGNADQTLTGNRTVTMGGNDLTFSGGNLVDVLGAKYRFAPETLKLNDYNQYIKLYGIEIPATASNRWAGIGVYNHSQSYYNSLSFFVNNADTNSEAMRLDYTGKLQLGTIGTASSLLHLNGGVGSTTGIAWGDGDTRLFEALNDNLYFQTGGTNRWAVTNVNTISGLTTGSAQIHNVATNNTTPVFSIVGDGNTGIGSAASNQLSLIAGGVEGIRISEDTDITIDNFGNTDNNGFRQLGQPSDAPIYQGSSYYFDGVDDQISHTLLQLDSDFSINFRLKFSNIGGLNINIVTAYSTTDFIWFRSAGNNTDVKIANTTYNISHSQLVDNTWYDISFIRDNGELSMFIDGIPQADTETTTGTYSQTHIGIRSGGTFPFGGQISDLQIFNYALSQDRIEEIYRGASTPYSEVGASQTELVTNGTFDTDTDWTKGAGWTISGGELVGTSVASATSTWQDIGLEVGKRYGITYTITNYSEGGVQVLLGGSGSTTGTIRSANGTYYEELINTSTGLSSRLYLRASGTTTLTIDNVSVTQIGEVLSLTENSISETEWLDQSGNALDGTVSGATVVNYKGWHTDGSHLLKEGQTISAATDTLDQGAHFVSVDYTSTGAVTSFTIPSDQFIEGREFTITDTGGNAGTNNITIDTEGSETINGSATLVLNGNYHSVVLYVKGGNLFIKSAYTP